MAEDIVELCSELERLLANDFPEHSQLARNLGRAFTTGGIEAAKPHFASLAFWGGSGSIADVCFVDHPISNRRLNLLLIDLKTAFERLGVTFARADSWCETFTHWESTGVFDKAVLKKPHN